MASPLFLTDSYNFFRLFYIIGRFYTFENYTENRKFVYLKNSNRPLIMKRYFLSFILTSIALSASALEFNASSDAVMNIRPEAQTGLNDLYVVRSSRGVKVSYTATSSGSVRWYRYGSNGAAYAEEIKDITFNGKISTITLGADDSGYVIEDGGIQRYYWIVNYENHVFEASSITAAEADCQSVVLDFSGSASPIAFYGINGRRHELSREIGISYYTLVYDEQSDTFVQTLATDDIESIEHTIRVCAPLCDTRFTLTGDRFLKFWNSDISIESDNFTSTAVDAHTIVTQETRENDNEQKVETGGLGGSAPCDITFKAAVTDAAVFYEWQLSQTPEFDVIDDRYNDLEFSYTFRNQGTTYVRFMAANADASCDWYSDSYEVFIGESKLECPNAFSPQTSPGVNDEWKVSYKSLISFECHIFNTWGIEMTSFKDPSMGWDGKYKGKYVPAGVYYYVINAVGSDGRKYKLSGDINIIGSSKNNNSTPTPETE